MTKKQKKDLLKISLKGIKNMRRKLQEIKLLLEFTIPIAKPTKREKDIVRNMDKMKFYSLEELKKKLKI